MLDYLIYSAVFLIVMLLTSLIRKNIRGFLLADLLRTLLFFIPFLLPGIYYGLPDFTVNLGDNFIAYIIAITGSVIGLSIHFKEIKPYFNKDLYYLFPPLPLKWFLITEFSLVGSAIFEEIFYRAFIPKSSILIEIIISVFLFTIAHFIQEPTRVEFTKKDYITLVIISIFWYLSFNISGSILPAIIGHLIYNSPKIITTIIHFNVSLKNSSDESIEQNI